MPSTTTAPHRTALHRTAQGRTAQGRTARGRTAAVLGLVAVLGVGLAGCAGAVVKEDVAREIDRQLSAQGVQAQGTSCPADLEAEVGKSVRCEFTVDEQPVDVVATVTSKQGDTVNYDIRTEARPIAKPVLDRKVADEVARQLAAEVDGADCSGDLMPTVDDTVTCTVSGGGEQIEVRVAVTSVDGGLIGFSLEAV